MTDETEQTDDHLALIARANGKAPNDDHSHRTQQHVSVPLSVPAERSNAPIYVGIIIVGILAAIAIGIAVNADYTSFLAERRAALAHNHADVATAKVDHLEDVMTIRGIIIPPMPKQEKADVERR